jgi:hypothetical protein
MSAMRRPVIQAVARNILNTHALLLKPYDDFVQRAIPLSRTRGNERPTKRNVRIQGLDARTTTLYKTRPRARPHASPRRCRTLLPRRYVSAA